MGFKQGIDRGQISLLPSSVEEFVSAESSVRVIDAFVDRLEFKALGFSRFEPAHTGRPAYDPACLTKLFLFGYLNGVRSSRRLEVETQRNLEVIWLMRWLQPDFKTLCDFRRDNGECFGKLFREFNLLCRSMNLFGAELVAIDGAKFKASNNFRRNMDAEQLRKGIDHIDANIERYLSDTEEADRLEAERQSQAGKPLSVEEATKIVKERMESLKTKRSVYVEALAELEGSGEKSISLTDPDSKRMRYSRGREGLVGYNVQVAVDAKHGLIAAQEVVTSANDLNELGHMAAAAQEMLRPEESVDETSPSSAEEKRPPLKVLADSGYFNADELKVCEELSVETFVSYKKTSSGKSTDGVQVFPKESFIFLQDRNAYVCPANQILTLHEERIYRGDLNFVYRTNACTGCALKSQCTKTRYRTIYRRDTEAASERARSRIQLHPGMRLTRQGTVEKIFGSLRTWGHDKFLTRGLTRVRAEFSLSALSYNIKRAIQIYGVEELINKMSPT